MARPTPFRILTVCTGNLCRSPLAEGLLRVQLAEHVPTDSFVVESAGVGAVVGAAMDAHAAAELRRLGGNGDGFAARQATGESVGAADLVLTACRDIRARTLHYEPRALKRVFTLGEFAQLSGHAPPRLGDAAELTAWAASHRTLADADGSDIADPMGQSVRVHRSVADLIDEKVRLIAKVLGPLL